MNTEKELPKRLRIIKGLQAHLSQISKIDGYYNDLAGKVFRNRILLGEDIRRDFPAVSVIEAPRPDIAMYAGDDEAWSHNYLTLLIQGLTLDDKTENTVDNAYLLCNDVENSLLRLTESVPGRGTPKYPDEYLLGGIITGVEIAPAVVRPPEAQVSSTAFFYLAVRLGVAGKIGE